MKIGVISDTHGDALAWRQVIEGAFLDVDIIIHAGDILYHGPRNPLTTGYDPQTLAELINESPVPVIFAKGNCDADVDQMLLNYPIQSPYTYLHLNGLKIMVNHGAELKKNEMEQLVKLYKLNLFISGHTHIPKLQQVNKTVFLNPGSCSLPKGGFEPSVAIIEENQIYILDFKSEKVISKISL